MNVSWVAATVRGRGLSLRRLGVEGASRVAAATSLPDAIDALIPTAYGRELRAGMDLATAQHAINATLLWHLRVLAGWGPSIGTHPLRLFAAEFELANVEALFDRLRGGTPSPPYVLGSLGLSWQAIASAGTAAEVRRALRSSLWGDPETDDPDGIRLTMQLARTRLLAAGVPEAADWAITDASLILARVMLNGALGELTARARRDASSVLGSRWQQAASLPELVESLPRAGRAALSAVRELEDLFAAQVRRWAMLESSAIRLIARTPASAANTIGVAGAMMADAWRVSGALTLAALGGSDLTEVLNAAA